MRCTLKNARNNDRFCRAQSRRILWRSDIRPDQRNGNPKDYQIEKCSTHFVSVCDHWTDPFPVKHPYRTNPGRSHQTVCVWYRRIVVVGDRVVVASKRRNDNRSCISRMQLRCVAEQIINPIGRFDIEGIFVLCCRRRLMIVSSSPRQDQWPHRQGYSIKRRRIGRIVFTSSDWCFFDQHTTHPIDLR